MCKIWEFFETMDEFVYVSDISSYELIYMNQKALKTFGFCSPGDIAGKNAMKFFKTALPPAPCVTITN